MVVPESTQCLVPNFEGSGLVPSWDSRSNSALSDTPVAEHMANVPEEDSREDTTAATVGAGGNQAVQAVVQVKQTVVGVVPSCHSRVY
jgi:hypothetical protein